MSETEVRKFLESDPSADGLARLADELGGGRVTDVVRLPGGLDFATHSFRFNGARLVLKRSKPGAVDASIEFENLGFAQRSRVPTPEPVLLDEDGEWFSTPALVMTALPGRVELAPTDRDRWITDLARALAAIHATDAEGFPNRKPPQWARWAPWTDELDPRLDAIADAVERLRPLATTEPTVFAHTDFHPGNVLFEDGYLSGVVDWTHVELEPRQAAVAYCRKDLAILPGGDAPDRFLAAYESLVGVRLEHMALWDVLYGSRGLQWGHTWVPSFAEMGVFIGAGDIREASTRHIDGALDRARIAGWL